MFPEISVLAAAMPDLTVFQYSIVDNIFSMTVATMGAAALFLFLSRSTVDREYRPALLISGIVVSIACYHYFMIRHSWQGAYALSGDGYAGTGAAFNDFYRYADWILTVPLLMVELVAVLRLEKSKARSLLTRLVIAAGLMIALGYPGEVISSPEGWTTRVIWGALSSVPFFYILYVLWVELTASLDYAAAGSPQVDRGFSIGVADHVGRLPNCLRIWRNGGCTDSEGGWCGRSDWYRCTSGRLCDRRHDCQGWIWRADLLHRACEEHWHCRRRQRSRPSQEYRRFGNC